MQSANRYDGVHPRAVKFIRFHARQLARHRAVPGLEIEDYEQEFMADLLERSVRFDSSRSSYPTFADRLIRNRVTSLLESGSRMRTTSAGGHDGHAIVDAALETEGLWPTSRQHRPGDAGELVGERHHGNVAMRPREQPGQPAPQRIGLLRRCGSAARAP
jgi:hypothetical protein